MRRIVLTAAFVAAATSIAGCNSTSYGDVKDPHALLGSMEPSGLVVLPRVIPDGYFLESASANKGPGAEPLSGEAAKGALRFQASIAKNSSGSANGGVLNWCASRPSDFAKMCSETSGSTFFSGVVDGVKVIVYGDNVGVVPKSSKDLTTDISKSAWPK